MITDNDTSIDYDGESGSAPDPLVYVSKLSQSLLELSNLLTNILL